MNMETQTWGAPLARVHESFGVLTDVGHHVCLYNSIKYGSRFKENMCDPVNSQYNHKQTRASWPRGART